MEFNTSVLILTIISLCVSSIQPFSAAPASPIVIVPGLLGNQIEGKLNRTMVPNFLCHKIADWSTLWLNIELILPFKIDCLSIYLRMKYNPDTGKYTDNDGVQTRIPSFGMTDSIEYLDPDLKFSSTTNYFHNMVQHFVDKGYTRGKDIVGAPYDWRVSPNQHLDSGYYSNLKALIEKMYLSNGKQRVVLVVHSMGAINSLYFLTKYVDQSWKDTYIRTYVSIAGAWQGAAKSVKAFASGDNEGIIIDRDIWDRAGQRTSPSTAWLMPNPSETWTKEDVLVVTDKRNYSAFDYKALFDDMGYPRGYDMYLETMNLTAQLIPPNITLHCVYGGKVKTPLTFQYGPGEFPDTDPTTVYGDGDGTVNINSLLSCEQWKTKQHYPVYMRQVTGVSHVSMVKNQEVINIVDEVVYSTL